MRTRVGFLPGAGIGALVAVAAMLLIDPGGSASGDIGARGARLGEWLTLNLGGSSWLFAAVLGLFVVHLSRLQRQLARAADRRAVVELDQLTDVWIHLFIGIGVIWTAVGMRSALQMALADPDHALTDSAGSVLRKLVDGGILLALSTTIVGAVGGYLMRLGKTLYAGAALHDFYEVEQRSDMRALLASVERLERSLALPGEGDASR
ncbi:MAG: hypothetical protein RIC56_05215 [Pseudomonadales bacterium]